MEPTLNLTIKVRNYFSIQHIQSAALLTRKCFEIEQEYNGIFSDDIFSDHRSYVIGALFAAVSFLEATINELFADTVDNPFSEAMNCLDIPTKELMADLWKLSIPKTASYRTIEKFQIALTLARKQLLETGRSPVQDVSTIIVLRNDLIHFEPSWVNPEAETTNKKILNLEQQKRFTFNPLVSSSKSIFYPDRCLSHGCAEWAVINCIKFVEDFSARMGIPVPFDHVRDRLKTTQ